MQIMEAPKNRQITNMQWKINERDDLLTNGKNLSQDKNPIG